MEKVILVTGAGSGIGAGTAKVYAKYGYRVGVVDVRLEAAQRTAEEIKAAGGTALAVACDVAVPQQVDQAIEAVTQSLGLPTTLVNNAGVGGYFHRVHEVTDDEWDWIVNTNMRGTFMFCRNLLPKMKQAGYGRIVNVASIQGLFGSPRSFTYVGTKHAIVGYTKTIAAEWGMYGITCNAICPGYVDTAMGIHDDDYQGFRQSVLNMTPARMIATPEETGEFIHMMTSEHARYLNGAAIPFDGGITCYTGVTDLGD